MPRFLAVYTMPAANVTRFRAMPKVDQDSVDNAGIAEWAEWDKRNGGSIIERGGMVGKTVRVTKEGIAPATNDICGYLVVEAETIEEAAQMFADHPHITIFPGETIDIMPLVT